jgi:beta-N-acetylhexosaminidase
VVTPTPTKTPKKELSTKEKIAQLLAVPLDVNELVKNSSESASMLNYIENNNPGFIVYFGEKISTTSALLATATVSGYLNETKYAPLIAVDHEGGIVQRLNGEGFTKLEAWQKIVTTYSSAQQKAVFNQSARELKAVGVSIVFAPVIDLASNSAVLKTRVASDLNQTYDAASNFIYAFSQNGVMSVVKHFPGIGSISKDPHNTVSTIELSQTDTEIFSKILDKFANIGVMTTHVRLENKLSGKVCSLSEECLSQFAKSYPKVLLFTDDLTMKAAAAQSGTIEEKDITQIAIEAIKAGNDVLVFGKGVDTIVLEKVSFTLQKEYEDSENFKAKIDYSVQKILELKK